ncbi:MAG: hypothetical protein U0836_20365 [Pirellulales bacterium]
MQMLFLITAVFGGTILVCQFVMLLLGLGGGESVDNFDAPVDFHDGGGDLGGHEADAGGGHGASGSQHAFDPAALFKLLSFKATVAALAFFGLGGLAAQSAEFPPLQALVIAVVCGGAALVGMHKLLRLMTRLGADGSLRLERAIGKSGTVYLAIPPAGKGAGKIHLKLQNRLVELEAVNASAERIAAGATIVVVGLAGADAVQVEPLREPADAGP